MNKSYVQNCGPVCCGRTLQDCQDAIDKDNFVIQFEVHVHEVPVI